MELFQFGISETGEVLKDKAVYTIGDSCYIDYKVTLFITPESDSHKTLSSVLDERSGITRMTRNTVVNAETLSLVFDGLTHHLKSLDAYLGREVNYRKDLPLPVPIQNSRVNSLVWLGADEERFTLPYSPKYEFCPQSQLFHIQIMEKPGTKFFLSGPGLIAGLWRGELVDLYLRDVQVESER